MTQAWQDSPADELGVLRQLTAAGSRRRFLQWAGVTVGVTMIGCSDDNNGPTSPGATSLGTGDVGILNYAYALEQLEADFYTRAVASPYSGMPAAEMTVLTDIRDHEIVHREFLRTALGANAIGMLEFDFTSVNFSSRASVLGTAKVFEDLGVAAYNGAGALLVNGDLLLVAGKIVSVEGRHASAIRDLLNPNSADFAGDDVVTVDTGLDRALLPPAVLSAAGDFITTPLDASGLPTS